MNFLTTFQTKLHCSDQPMLQVAKTHMQQSNPRASHEIKEAKCVKLNEREREREGEKP